MTPPVLPGFTSHRSLDKRNFWPVSEDLVELSPVVVNHCVVFSDHIPQVCFVTRLDLIKDTFLCLMTHFLI